MACQLAVLSNFCSPRTTNNYQSARLGELIFHDQLHWRKKGKDKIFVRAVVGHSDEQTNE